MSDKPDVPLKFLLFVISFASFFLRAFVVMVTWKWFIADAVKLAEIGYAQALGVICFFDLFLTKYRSEQEDPEFTQKSLGFSFAHSLMVLFVAWVVQWFV